ncbi:uncharacterized protein LOC122499406 [Leptopilina heterotoma]|uniref:uncharacterized protein LOC122499406 n=1 Tax=Leptopilina heterotoma TaxID=63436 RepID=UPI001CA83F1A|nr:uncharacterized protein LOC122499406 [Leptopilina heterotoma]
MELEDEQITDVRKRRSSVFQRRSILFTGENNVSEGLDETKIDDNSSAPKENNQDAQNVAEAFDLQAYVDKLKVEISDWRDVIKERQEEYKKLMKKKSKLKKKGQEVDLNLLSADERKFFDNRPNLDLLMNNTKELMDMTVKTVILNQHYVQRYEYLQSLCEQKMNEAKEKLISMIDK